FHFDLLAGSPGSALDNASRVVLTESAALRLFGRMPALGQPLRVGGRDAIVGGGIRSVRQPSFLGGAADSIVRFEVIAPWTLGPGVEADARDLWTGTDGYTFAVAPAALTEQGINARLTDLIARRMPAGERAATKVSLKAIPVAELTTRQLDAS